MTVRTCPEVLQAILVRDQEWFFASQGSACPPTVAVVLFLHIHANCQITTFLSLCQWWHDDAMTHDAMTQWRDDAMTRWRDDVSSTLTACVDHSISHLWTACAILPLAHPYSAFEIFLSVVICPSWDMLKTFSYAFQKTPYSFAFHVRVFRPSGIYFCVCCEIDI